MKRNFILLFILFFFSFSFSQTVKLQWEGNRVIDFGSYKITVPSFKNEGFAFEESSIYFRSTMKYSGVNQKVTNFVWEKITPKEKY